MEAHEQDDPQRMALEHAVALLSPLREQRQARAERAQREARTELNSMLDHLSTTQAAIRQARDQHRQRRDSLSQAHLLKPLSLSDIDRWSEKEQAMIDRLAHMHQDVEQQRRRIAEQRSHLEQLQRQAIAAQRAVEKLACLSELLDGDA